MSIIGVIIVGFLVGVLARWFYPGVVEMGWVMTTVLGIAGSFLGGLLSSVLFKSPDGNFHPAGWFLSVVGAMIIIWGYFTFLK
ncbi:MAG: GlsB/YeaQ/YmgE family stress response membrane protein [Betaproteobacteria bacterium]|nr:MAG: GlsB/YeaQ/YmgE family stress response membrane protein [Betaproteobacteria bacterium]